MPESLLQRRVVVGVEVINPNDRPALLREPPRDVVADKARRTGDEDRICHAASSGTPWQFGDLGNTGTPSGEAGTIPHHQRGGRRIFSVKPPRPVV
jgi:hypothetical protein